MGKSDARTVESYVDVVIVGAGLSGIGAGYRVQTECPDKTYAILEARESIGGTWDLFRYPGVRSDSDMFTLGYEFQPWTEGKSIADGASILHYITDTARIHGIDRNIRFRTKVVEARWSSVEQMWTLIIEKSDDTGTRSETLRCNFLYSCAGYYDYDNPYNAELPGLENFEGTVVHPQFWPQDLNYTNKKIVIVGSGATAVTLVPSLAKDAARVTMLQRSPTWISPVPSRDKFADRVRAVLPAGPAHRLIRTKNILFGIGFYQFCRRRPAAARKLLTDLSTRILGDEKIVAEHFTPSYNPWDQRLCAVPNADLFKSIEKGDASVITDRIDTFVPGGVSLESGTTIDADIVVTATGLQLRAFGGMSLIVDGEPVALSHQVVWQGTMMTGVPNFAICIGYTNASWTLRAELTSKMVCKVLRYMDRTGVRAVAPHTGDDVARQPLLDLASGYVQRSIDAFPGQGKRHPWRMRQNYVLDALSLRRTRLSASLRPVAKPPASVSDIRSTVGVSS